jgi:hypothetical protein
VFEEKEREKERAEGSGNKNLEGVGEPAGAIVLGPLMMYCIVLYIPGVDLNLPTYLGRYLL